MKEAGWARAKADLATTFCLDASETSGAHIGALALVQASSELSNLVGDEDRTLECAAHYLDIALPGCSPSVLKRVRLNTDGKTTPEWVSGYNDDHEVTSVFPSELLLLGMVRTIPRGASDNARAWGYIDSACERLDQDPQLISDFHGWLVGSADQDVTKVVEGLRASLATLNDTCAAVVRHLVPVPTEVRSTSFPDVQAQLLKLLEQAAPHLDAFHMDRTRRQHLMEYLSVNRFRLAVLGEFKRGKSTLINAIGGLPDLMPSDILACTSALTELRHGEEPRFEVNYDGPLGDFRPGTKTEFQKGAGAASSPEAEAQKKEAKTKVVPYWRVLLPSPFLKGSCISLIDSPGLGEDAARDAMARAEAERADAAIIVLDIGQLGSTLEMDLVGRMKGRASDLILVVNKADTVGKENWQRCLDHVRRRLADVTGAVSDDRVVLLSASLAEDGVRAGRKRDTWTVLLKDLRKLIERHLINRAGPIKLKVIRDKVRKFSSDAKAGVTAQLELREKLVEEVDNLEQAMEHSKELHEKAARSIDRGTKILVSSKGPANRFSAAFFGAIPGLLDSMEQDKGQWTSKHSVLRPKKHVEEVATKAQESLIRRVEAWVRDEGGRLLAQEVEGQYKQAIKELQAINSDFSFLSSISFCPILD